MRRSRIVITDVVSAARIRVLDRRIKYLRNIFDVTLNDCIAACLSDNACKAFTYNAGYKLIVPLGEHLELSQSSNYSYLDSAIAGSPIVDGKQQWNANLALTYYF